MHPQMTPQYLHNDFGLLASPHLHSNGKGPHPTQSLVFNGYDSPNYSQDPYAQFDTSKPLNQPLYVPPSQQQQQQQQAQHLQQQHQTQHQHQHSHPSTPSANNFILPPYPQNMYSSPMTRRHQPSTSISSDDSLPTPTVGRYNALRMPHFDRTYVDALEDELYDESTSTSHSFNSQNHDSRQATPNFSLNKINSYADPMHTDKNIRVTMLSDGGYAEQKQPGRQTAFLAQNKPVSAVIGPQSNLSYNPLGNRYDLQQLSSASVAGSMRCLQPPSRTTVSPRETFLEYPDNADFRERTMLSKSTSPYPQNREVPGVSNHQGTESDLSNENDHAGSDVPDASVSHSSIPYSLSETTLQYHPTSGPIISRSNSASTRESEMLSRDISAESSNSSDSEYNPAATTGQRTNRSSGRLAPFAKTFACSDCGKRFDKSQLLQAHRRNSHGKGKGPPTLSNQKFSNTSHRCDWVEPTTGKMCNTVFSRPYDLIRHYETKHSAKRQEFICPHCEDRKSFSRSDALRRHLRVKHPSSGRK